MVFVVVVPGYCLDPVTLYMSSPCPGNQRPTFTCLTRGTNLEWVVNGEELTFTTFSFVGEDRNTMGFQAVLWGISTSETEGELRTSILTIGESVPAGMLTIECNNNDPHSRKTMQYHHETGMLYISSVPVCTAIVDNAGSKSQCSISFSHQGYM